MANNHGDMSVAIEVAIGTAVGIAPHFEGQTAVMGIATGVGIATGMVKGIATGIAHSFEGQTTATEIATGIAMGIGIRMPVGVWGGREGGEYWCCAAAGRQRPQRGVQ